MAHLPVNHPARPFYRVLSGAVGLYILVFGIVGFVRTQGEDFFAREDTWALGLQTNPAFSILSVLAGGMLLGGALAGRNVDHFLNLAGGVLFLVAGIIMMTLLRTEANLLNFAMPNVIASLLIGVALLSAGLYGKVGSTELADAEDQFRHGRTSEGETVRSAADTPAADTPADATPDTAAGKDTAADKDTD